MVGRGWKLTATDLSTLAEDEPMLDKIAEVIELSDDELALVSGGRRYGGYHRRHHRRYGYHHHRRHHRRY